MSRSNNPDLPWISCNIINHTARAVRLLIAAEDRWQNFEEQGLGVVEWCGPIKFRSYTWNPDVSTRLRSITLYGPLHYQPCKGPPQQFTTCESRYVSEILPDSMPNGEEDWVSLTLTISFAHQFGLGQPKTTFALQKYGVNRLLEEEMYLRQKIEEFRKHPRMALLGTWTYDAA